ncbi:MAG TPA: 30S ribosomal protein S14 [Alphaproteobacteria bacterium]|nr:30S ribosomal protein S14 [Rhodospirillaceae bacterium]HRJ11818.1 30S ribosomal protein S14 [Alphaproteobacteria bacterium]
MAKVSRVNKNNKVARMVKKFATKRAKLKAVANDRKADLETRFEATQQLAALPRNGAANRYRNRCELTGCPRSVYSKFRLSRNMLRKLANEGMLPGVQKSSW